MSKKRLFVVLLLILLLFLAAINQLFYSTITITINGDHSPVNTRVLASGNRVFPQGESGKVYTARVRPGDTVITFGGPLTKRVELVVSTGLFDKEEVVINTESVSIDTIGSDIDILFERVSLYGYLDNWAIGVVNSRDISGKSRDVRVLNYSYDTFEWVEVVSGSKIDPLDQRLALAPRELLDSLGEVAGD